MTVFSDFNSRRPRRIWDGIQARAVSGQRVTMALVDLEPNVALQEHHHPNEQVGFVVQGELTFTVGGETRTLGAGETYSIRPDVAHSAVAGPEGCVVVDVFAPVRADWEAVPDGDPSPSSWSPGG
jgi:quercetin dioxygenase-like cupin family protein